MADPHTTAREANEDAALVDALVDDHIDSGYGSRRAMQKEIESLRSDLAAARADLQLAEEAGEKWMLKAKAALAQVEALREDIRSILDIAGGWARFKGDAEKLAAIKSYGEGALASSEVPATEQTT